VPIIFELFEEMDDRQGEDEEDDNSIDDEKMEESVQHTNLGLCQGA
jgi:hypothetical protein